MLLNSTGLCELSGSGSKIRTHLKDNRHSAGFRINVDTHLSTDHKATFSSVVVLGDGSRPRLVLDLLVSVCVNPFHLLLHFVCCESLSLVLVFREQSSSLSSCFGLSQGPRGRSEL